MQLYFVPKSKAVCDLSQLQKRILYKFPTCCFIGDLPDQWHPHCNSRTNSDDDNNYYHSCLLLIPPASICLYLHINISLSILTSALLTISLSVVCFSCMCLSEDPLVQQIGSLSLCSQLDRENINASLSFKKTLSSMSPSTPAFLGFSSCTSPDLSYRLSQ